MPFNLPPKEQIGKDPDSVLNAYTKISNTIAYHSGASGATPWIFYEELDKWLGPWGKEGYPIGYGKFYCIAFNSSLALKKDLNGRNWIMGTTILLQEFLRDFIIAKIKNGSIAKTGEAELRAAAFASHPKAYTDAGLKYVMLLDPQLIPIVMTIPSREIIHSPVDTLVQMVITSKIIAGQVAADSLISVMPVHAFAARRHINAGYDAILSDQRSFRNQMEFRTHIANGKFDNIIFIRKLIAYLNSLIREQPDHWEEISETIRLANQRETRILTENRSRLDSIYRQNPGISSYIKNEVERNYQKIVTDPVRN